MNDGTQQLPETSRNALIYIADQLRRGYTGRFVLDCSEGAIAEMTETQKKSAKDLKDRAA